MDLALWALARRVRADAAAATALRTGAPAELGEAYRAGTLPPTLQDGLRAFLAAYGHRGVAEIDVGLPRWSEAPDHLFGVLANYLSVDGASGGDAQFRAAAAQAEATLRQVACRAGRRGRWRRY